MGGGGGLEDRLAVLVDRLERAIMGREKLFFTLAEAASHIGASLSYVRRAVRQGLLPASNLANSPKKNIFRVARADLEAFMARRRDGAVLRGAKGPPPSRHYGKSRGA